MTEWIVFSRLTFLFKLGTLWSRSKHKIVFKSFLFPKIYHSRFSVRVRNSGSSYYSCISVIAIKLLSSENFAGHDENIPCTIVGDEYFSLLPLMSSLSFDQGPGYFAF